MKEYKIVNGRTQWDPRYKEKTAEVLSLLALDGWEVFKVTGAWTWFEYPEFVLVRERKK